MSGKLNRSGGTRKHAGRKPSSSTEKTRAVADKVNTDGGVTPLEVISERMRYHFGQYRAHLDTAEEADKTKAPCANAERGEAERHLEAADEAASRAAPYCHPRLASIEFSGNVKMTHEMALKELMDGDAPDQKTETA